MFLLAPVYSPIPLPPVLPDAIMALLADSSRFTTVSPSYAWEIGGHPAINAHLHKFMGIRNGIDPDIWDPELDPFLEHKFTAGEAGPGVVRASS